MPMKEPLYKKKEGPFAHNSNETILGTDCEATISSLALELSNMVLNCLKTFGTNAILLLAL
jgi:hypothetical protein